MTENEHIDPQDISQIQQQFQLASERSLDTMNISGNRNKLSQGQLPEIRQYTAANKEKITIHRSFIDGQYQEITQSDLDVLRAIITMYVKNVLHYTFDTKKSAEDVLGMPDELDREWTELVADGEAELIEATPTEIRRILGKTKDELPTKRITEAFNRLLAVRISGNYKVRSDGTVINVPINGRLLDGKACEMADTNRISYMAAFLTKWGQLFMHNVQSGNLTWIKSDNYRILGNGEKAILYTVMAFKGKEFIRRTDDVIEMVNIKLGKNNGRARNTLNKYLVNLTTYQFIEWYRIKDIVYITRLHDPKNSINYPCINRTSGNLTAKVHKIIYSDRDKANAKGLNSERDGSKQQESTLKEKRPIQSIDVESRNEFSNIIDKLKMKVKQRKKLTDMEGIYYTILCDIEIMARHLRSYRNLGYTERTDKLKELIKKDAYILSEHYLRSHDFACTYFNILQDRGSKRDAEIGKMVMERINSIDDSIKEEDIDEWIRAVSEIYNVPYPCNWDC